MDDVDALLQIFRLWDSAVRDARADDNQEVARGNGAVCIRFSVVAEHAEVERVIFRQYADAHHRVDERNPVLFAEGAEFRFALAENHAAARADQRFFRLLNRGNHAGQLEAVALDVRLIAAHRELFGIGKRLFQRLHLDINRNINEHGPLAAGIRDVEGLFEDARNLVGIFDEIGVFDKRLGRAAHIGLLKHIASEERGVDLSRDGNERNGIRVGGCECRD